MEVWKKIIAAMGEKWAERCEKDPMCKSIPKILQVTNLMCSGYSPSVRDVCRHIECIHKPQSWCGERGS
jgi:hypothetical protein